MSVILRPRFLVSRLLPSMMDIGNDSAEEARANEMEDQLQQGKPQLVTLPTYSSRTLHHPSFLSLYMAVGSMPCNWKENRGLCVPAMIPSDFYYTDSTLPPGCRVPNTVTQLEALECCQLNTPPPVMSVIPALPLGPDPFRTGPHPTRDLGTEVWTWDRCINLSTFRSRTGQEQTVEVIQMSPEEDQAITSLLQLHYHSQQGTISSVPPGVMSAQDLTAEDHRSHSKPIPAQPSLYASGPASGLAGDSEPSHSLLECQSKQRSEVEMEAASVLLSLEEMSCQGKSC